MRLLLIIAFITFIFILLPGCAPSVNLPARFAEIQDNGYYQHRYIHIEPSFSSTQQTLIKRSFEIWTKSTNGYLRWTIRPWPDNWWNVTPKELEEEFDKCSKHVLVFRNTSEDKTVFDIETKVNKTISGAAIATHEECGTEQIMLVVDRMKQPKTFIQVTLHEIGHILYMDHDDKGRVGENARSIMNYGWMWFLDKPTDYDLKWLLKINHLYYH